MASLPPQFSVGFSDLIIPTLSNPSHYSPFFTLHLHIQATLVTEFFDEGILTDTVPTNVMEPRSFNFTCRLLEVLNHPHSMTQLLLYSLRGTVFNRRFRELTVYLSHRIVSFVADLVGQGTLIVGSSFYVEVEARVDLMERLMQRRMKGATESALRRLEKERFDGGEDTSEACAICLEEMGSKNGKKRLTRMPCSHVFHYQCIIGWLNGHNTCPMCRSNVNEM